MRNVLVDAIRDMAIAQGACEIADKIVSWRTLAKAMFSPQGAEFLQKHKDFPSIELCRQAGRYTRRNNIYVDCPNIRIDKVNNAAFIGNTHAEVSCFGTSTVHTYIVMHGASLIVNASKFAVVRIYNIGGKVDINNDGTAKILE